MNSANNNSDRWLRYSLFALPQLCCLLMVLVTSLARADNDHRLNLANNYDAAIGNHFAYLQSTDPLTAAQVLERYNRQQLTQSKNRFLSFGLANRASVWLVATVDNPFEGKLMRQVSVATSWLEEVEIYLFQQGTQLQHLRMGDNQVYAQRPIDRLDFGADIQFPSGRTQLLIKVTSLDPMVLPIYLRSHAEEQKQSQLNGYHYGLLYGAMIALLLYNLLLAVSLGYKANLVYSFYMFSFVVMNMSYSGHGFALFWPESPVWQQWSNPVFMSLYSVMGMIFAIVFLELRQRMPAIYRILTTYIPLTILLLILAIAFDSHRVAIVLAFLNVLIFTLSTAIIGGLAAWRKLPSANYFFIATIIGVSSACSTCITVWGLIPYHPMGYFAIEAGILIEAILLSLALADRINKMEKEKNIAHQEAQVDHLSTLYNRRGYSRIAPEVWEKCITRNTGLAIIALDIDNFKQINDTYGHNLGDDTIRTIAALIKTQCRPEDMIVRWGGDEFLMLLPKTNAAQAKDIAERCRKVIETHYQSTSRLGITISAGIAEYAKTDRELDDLIQRADANLYQAKTNGRNQVVVG